MTDLQRLGEARLLEAVRAEAKPTAQSMVWSFSRAGDEMCLEIEWICNGELRRDIYLSSSVDVRYVHLVERSADKEMSA